MGVPTPGTPSPGTDVFSEAARAGLTAINATTLAVCTAVSAALTVYADVVAAAPQFTAYIALAAWLASITLALVLAGRGSVGGREASVLRALGRGFAMARARPGFAAIVLLLSMGAAFTVWSRARSDQGGVLSFIWADARRAATAAESTNARTVLIQNDTQAIRSAVTKAETPREALARLGYVQKPDAICRAIVEGDVKAMQLFKEAGMSVATVGVALGGGQWSTCIEPALLRPKGASTHAALKVLKISPDELNRLYVAESFGSGSEGSLKAAQLVAKLGIADAGKARLSSVRAAPLMFAVWGANTEAVTALLAQGAEPNEGGRLDFLGSPMFTVSASPLEEAIRLGHREAAAALQAAGGRESLQRLPYFK